MPYAAALEVQRAVARARITGDIDQDVLLLVEHPHVVTLGRSAKGRTLTTSPQLLAAKGVELFEVDRGGDVTYHGPGQLVGYPIFDLKRHKQDLHWYLRQVEEALIVALRDWGLTGERSAGYTGVWVAHPSESSPSEASEGGERSQGSLRKIASIGVHARDWVTWHGFALNVATDLSYFDLMIPCGIDGVEMTSIVREVGGRAGDVTLHHASQAVTSAFTSVFSLNADVLERDVLESMLARLASTTAA